MTMTTTTIDKVVSVKALGFLDLKTNRQTADVALAIYKVQKTFRDALEEAEKTRSTIFEDRDYLKFFDESGELKKDIESDTLLNLTREIRDLYKSIGEEKVNIPLTQLLSFEQWFEISKENDCTQELTHLLNGIVWN